MGSFLNAWMWRTKEEKSIVTGRSECPTCHEKLRWYDNVPLISFVYLKGRCRYCKKSISWQYPLVELWMGIAFVAIATYHGVGGEGIDAKSIEILRDSMVVFFLTFVFVYDVKYQEIWDRATTVPALMYVPFALYFGWHTWWSMSLGVVIAAGFFLLQFVLSKGKWIGGGDVRLGVLMGVVLGFPSVLVALFFAYIMGAIGGLTLMAFGKANMASKMPFGTYLSVATIIALFWGERIVGWYLGFM